MLNILINNQIEVNGEAFEISKLTSFISNEAIINNPDYENALNQNRSIKEIEDKFYFYEKKSDTQVIFTRGLKNKLISYLNLNNIKFELKEDYKSNGEINIENNIEKLREYQLDLEKELDNIDQGYILVPTGGGKTVVMINEIAKKKQKTFLLIHNTKLLHQFVERLKQFSNIDPDDIGIYGDGKKEIKPITIALMQSFGKLSEKKIREISSEFDLFFIDETHHLVAKTFLKIGKNVKSKRFYGLTATPDKKEGLAVLFLERIIGDLVFKVTEEKLQEHNVILKPHLIPVVNQDSYLRDIYNDFFKFEDRKVIKYYTDQFENLPFTQNYMPLNLNETTLVVSDNNQSLINFENKLPENLKRKSKLITSSIFKKNQFILENNSLVIAKDTPENYKRIDMHKIKKQLYGKISRSNLVYNCIIEEFKNNKDKDPNILVLSDRIEHLEFMYDNLPDVLKKYATKLHGKMKKKERDLVEIEIIKKEKRIIFASEKFVGEGWDIAHLNVLIITHLLKDHESLKQLVGRVIRSSPGKKHSTVYDIVDINCPITFNQFKKRYNNYYFGQSTCDAKIDFYNKIIN